VRFSFTRLATYRRCPFQYKLRYQHHLPGQPRPGTRLGVALHAALATFYRDRRPVPWPDDLLAAFDAQWPTDLVERDVRAMDEGRAILVDYFRRQGDSWPAVRFIEEPFRLELGRYTLVGTLDRVDELPDATLHIVDYKTARTPPQIPCKRRNASGQGADLKLVHVSPPPPVDRPPPGGLSRATMAPSNRRSGRDARSDRRSRRPTTRPGPLATNRSDSCWT
jgi:hypothetical protein